MGATNTLGTGKEYSEEDMQKLLKSRFVLRMQLGTQQANDTSQVKKTRRDIARLLTIKNQKAAGK